MLVDGDGFYKKNIFYGREKSDIKVLFVGRPQCSIEQILVLDK